MEYGDDPREQVPSPRMGRQMRERLAAFRSTGRNEHHQNSQDGWDDANAEMLEADHRDDGEGYHEARERAEEGESARYSSRNGRQPSGWRISTSRQGLRWATRGTSSLYGGCRRLCTSAAD